MGFPTSEMSREIESGFILESEKQKSAFEIRAFRKACTSVFTESMLPAAFQMNMQSYYQFIDKAYSNLTNVVSSNSEELINFFGKSYDGIDKMNVQITIPMLNINEIDSFRPQYLMEISSDFAQNIKKILGEEFKVEQDLKDFVGSEYETKIKRQLVKTTFPANAEREQILSNDNPPLVPISSNFLKNNINPFLRMAPQYLKEMNDDITKMKTYMERSSKDMLAVIKVINEMKASGKIVGKVDRLINYYTINANRIYMNTVSYLTFLTIRKMNIISFNMVSFFNLHNTLLNYYPEGQRVIHESVFDGKLDDVEDGDIVSSILNGDTSIISSFAQASIEQKKESITAITSKLLGVNVYDTIDQRADEYDYDSTPYVNAVKIFLGIGKGLRKMHELSGNQNMIYDDILTQSGFDCDIYAKYSSIITTLDSVDGYVTKHDDVDKTFTDQADIMMLMYNELIHFTANVQLIANTVSETYKYLKLMRKEFEDNPNGKYTSVERVNELISFLDVLDKVYRDIVLSVSKKLISRLNSLSSIVEDINEALPVETDEDADFSFSEGVDYVSMVIESLLTEMEEEKESIFTEMHKEYTYLRNKRDRGVKIIFEASKPAEQKKKINKFAGFVDGILETFNQKVAEKVANNSQWISRNKEKLLSLDTNDIKFNVVPYENVTDKTILAYITAVTSNVANLNQARFNSFKSKEDLDRYLFPFVPENIGSIDDINGKLKLVLTVGKTEKVEAIEFTGGSAATQIKKMVQYCETYGNYSSKVANAIDALKKATENTINALGNKSVQESVILNMDELLLLEAGAFEDDGSSKDTSGTASLSVAEIQTSVKLFIGSVLNAIRDRYFDYIRVLGEEIK